MTVNYVPSFIADPDVWFNTLWADLAWERRPDALRREYWTTLRGQPYTYGRGRGMRTYQPQPDHRLIMQAREQLQMHGVWLEGCFLNGYESERDWLGWHADDDPGIDHSKPIAVITVGQGRAIQFRKIIEPVSETSKGVFTVPETLFLESGSLCLMPAGMQFTHQHRIPKVSNTVKPRISLTFRGLLSP